MKQDRTLVCTDCDEVVTVQFGFEGYVGACGCQTHPFAAQGDRGHPTTWESFGDASSTDDFAFYHEGMVHDGEVLEDSFAVCLVCNESDALETVPKEENLDVFGRDLKIQIRCENDHYFDDRQVEETVYLPSDGWRAEVAKRIFIEGRV